jgi:acyl-coenzyme A thioesterase PaaI-like protein
LELDDRAELADALRRVLDATVRLQHDPAALRAATAQAEALAELLEGGATAEPAVVTPGGWEGQTPDDLGRFMPLNPILGHANAMAPPLKLVFADGQVTGSVRFGLAYVGPPGRAHGGVVASILDQVVGAAAIAGGRPSFTGTLTVRFHAATPLDTDLSVAGHLVETSGRRNQVWGAILDGDKITAEAEAVMISANSST